MSQRIEIRPQKGPQTRFLWTKADICIYGGAAFGGKTWALLVAPLRHRNVKGFGTVIFRRTYKEITIEGGMWDESSKIYPLFGAVPHRNALYWQFPSGVKVSFAHMQHEKDKYSYHGAQIPLICFDQLEDFSATQFFYMLSRNRGDCPIPPRMRGTVNPDPDSWMASFLSWWIDDEGYAIEERSGKKRYFVREGNALIWSNSVEDLIERGYVDSTALVDPDERPKSVSFIGAKVEDNPIGLRKNPGYIVSLRSMFYVDQMRLLHGNWKVRPEAGKLVNRDWFRIVPDFPCAGGQACLFWDFAATAKKIAKSDPDYTAGVLMLKDRGKKIGDLREPSRFCVADMRAEQADPADVEDLFLSFTRQCAEWCRIRRIRFKVRWEQEPGSASKLLSRKYVMMLAGIAAGSVPSRGEKIDRGRPFMAQAKARNVDVLEGAWNERWLSHEHNMPDQPHDDIWDGTNGAFNEVVKKWSARWYHGTA